MAFNSSDNTYQNNMPKTYFGLQTYKLLNGKIVKQSDIAKLPFCALWQEKSAGSTILPLDDNDFGIYLHDWEKFCRIFIKTGE